MLDRLRALSEQLATQHGWATALATVFVLTGRAPLIPAVRMRVSSAGRGRIVLDVDPGLTPRELADTYRRLRREVLGKKRVKRLGRKHLDLAVFASGRPDDEPWETRRVAWNREHPEPQYAYEQNRLSYFKRDCLQAQQRLLTPRIGAPEALGWLIRQSDDKGAVHDKAKRTRRG